MIFGIENFSALFRSLFDAKIMIGWAQIIIYNLFQIDRGNNFLSQSDWRWFFELSWSGWHDFIIKLKMIETIILSSIDQFDILFSEIFEDSGLDPKMIEDILA